ncbi:MAG: histidine phosphatase family protein [Planctomycetota bacterium]|jgi:broad specificity phosphatase PhoE
MRRIRLNLIMRGIFCGTILLAGCPDGFQGVVTERTSGSKIPDVNIRFISEDGSTVKSKTSDNNGYYKITLNKGRYWVTAAHPDYEDYSSIPGFFVVTGDGYQTGNIFLREPRVTTALLVRHAEKVHPPSNPDTETPLTEDGEARARKLADVARRAGVTAIYATSYKRTQQTVQPLADFLKLAPIIYNDAAQLVNQILSEHSGDVVLVAGHSPTVPDIARRLGADVQVGYLDDFDNLFTVTRKTDEANAVNLQYGEPSPPGAGGSFPGESSYPMTTVLLVRHVEGGSAGQARAEKLSHVALKVGVAAIYASPTQETVSPLADICGLQVNSYNSDDVQELVNKILSDHVGELVVVAGHRETLSEIITKLGGSPLPILYNNEHDNLVVLTVCDPGDAKVVSLQYGESSP